MPDRDFRSIYHLDTRLSSLAGDELAQVILAQELPQLFGILKEDNQEFTTQTFRELGHAFYLGLSPEKVAHTVARLAQIHHFPRIDV